MFRKSVILLINISLWAFDLSYSFVPSTVYQSVLYLKNTPHSRCFHSDDLVLFYCDSVDRNDDQAYTIYRCPGKNMDNYAQLKSLNLNPAFESLLSVIENSNCVSTNIYRRIPLTRDIFILVTTFGGHIKYVAFDDGLQSGDHQYILHTYINISQLKDKKSSVDAQFEYLSEFFQRQLSLCPYPAGYLQLTPSNSEKLCLYLRLIESPAASEDEDQSSEENLAVDESDTRPKEKKTAKSQSTAPRIFDDELKLLVKSRPSFYEATLYSVVEQRVQRFHQQLMAMDDMPFSKVGGGVFFQGIMMPPKISIRSKKRHQTFAVSLLKGANEGNRLIYEDATLPLLNFN